LLGKNTLRDKLPAGYFSIQCSVIPPSSGKDRFRFEKESKKPALYMLAGYFFI
jgi:hypothetical protein